MNPSNVGTALGDFMRITRFAAELQPIRLCLAEAQKGHDEWAVSHVGLSLKNALRLAQEGDRIVHWSQDVGTASARMFGSPSCLQTDASNGKHDEILWQEMQYMICNIWFRKAGDEA